LRNLNDARHINIAELDAVIKGVGMVYQTKRALCLDSIQVTIHCDNSSVVAWVNSNEARHWRAARGTSAAAVEGKLQTLTDNIMSGGIHNKVVNIESEKNLGDCLSRIPLYMLPEAQSADLSDAKMLDEEACMLVIPRIRNDVIRNESGLIVMNENDPKFLKLLHILHEHEGAQVLFERVRQLVQVPNLRAICRAFVARCADCHVFGVIFVSFLSSRRIDHSARAENRSALRSSHFCDRPNVQQQAICCVINGNFFSTEINKSAQMIVFRT
jgi:hypothetical protein